MKTGHERSMELLAHILRGNIVDSAEQIEYEAAIQTAYRLGGIDAAIALARAKLDELVTRIKESYR